MTDDRIFKSDSCEVEVICDSISVHDRIRIITVRLRYWRSIHSELMTHRVFSRNARSSRAVPVTTLLKEEPYVPHFLKNQPGMQALEELEPEALEAAQLIWQDMIKQTRLGVEALHKLGVHKQWANRPLEWFGYIDVLVTSTDWSNWFALRDHTDAAPEIHELARLMGVAFNASSPRELGWGEWHLPYVLPEEGPTNWHDENAVAKLQVLSAARSARISYKPFDGNADYGKEWDRYTKLVLSAPVHASPTEHQATPDTKLDLALGKGQRIQVWQEAAQQGNFVGWKQHRKEIPHEAVLDDHYYVNF
jgi:hypothetical protein